MIGVRTTGLGEHNLALELDPLTLLVGPNGSGKSTAANAIRIAALGYVPQLGRTEAATAQLLSDREMSVEVGLGNRIIRRTLRPKPKGGYSMAAECSWLGESATADEHAAAAVGLFGGDSQSVAECLDIRQLLALTGNQRAARIERLISASTDAQAQCIQVARYTMQRLAAVADERMPEDQTTLRPLVQGWAKDGAHTGQYRVLSEVWPAVKAKLQEAGLAAATAWANELKRDAATGLRQKGQARKELALRLESVPAPDPGRIATMEARRGELEREHGAVRERRVAAAGRAEERHVAGIVRDQVARDLHRAQRARNEYGRSPDATPELAELEERIDALRPPTPPAADELDGMEEQAKALEEQAYALVLPELPDVAEAANRVAGLEVEQATVQGSPWWTVRDCANAITDLVQRGAKGRTHLAHDVEVQCTILLALADRYQTGRDPVEIAQLLTAAREALEEAGVAAEAAASKRATIATERQRLLDEAAALRTRLATQRTEQRQRYRRATDDYEQQAAALRKQRDHLRATGAARTERNRETAVALDRAEMAVKAAQDRLLALGEPVAVGEGAGDDSTEAPGAELGRVQTELTRLLDDQSLHAEFARLVAEIDAAGAEHAVWVAIEEAAKRVRADEVAREGGPLVAFLDRYLRAAGRPEGAYVLADRGVCDFGWRTPGGATVSIAAMSGGEWTLFAAGLTAAVVALRAAEQRLLIVEAGECDTRTLEQLLLGVADVANELTAALVLTCHQPAQIPAGWSALTPRGERLAEAA